MSWTGDIFSIFRKWVKQNVWELYDHFEVQTAAFFWIKTVFSLYMGQVIHTLCRAIMNLPTSDMALLPQNQPLELVQADMPSQFLPEGKIARATFFNIGRVVNTTAELMDILVKTVREMGATMIEGTQIQSTEDPNCLSVGVILSESSAFIHLMRNTRHATAVVFTCGEKVHPNDGAAILDRELEAEKTLVTFGEIGGEYGKERKPFEMYEISGDVAA